MKKALISTRNDRRDAAWWAVYQLARGRFIEYAARHGYEYLDFWYEDFDPQRWPGVAHGRAPSWAFDPSFTSPYWLKIPALAQTLERFDLVTYLDNDCLILDFSKDIADELPADKWLAMHESITYEGTSPNAGVIVARACEQSAKFWREAWTVNIPSKWFDNGAIMHLLGFYPNPPARKLRDTEYSPGYHVLGEEWNGCGNAPGTVKPGQRIFHAAYGRDGYWKHAVMRSAASMAPIPAGTKA